MQKVALITFHRALNYGAALQTYATCKILRDMGYEVELIDVRIAERQNLIRRIATLLKKWRFARFRKRYYPKQTVRYHTMTEIRNNPPRADYYMVGSDQTWNPLITGEMAEAFFLDFVQRPAGSRRCRESNKRAACRTRRRAYHCEREK